MTHYLSNTTVSDNNNDNSLCDGDSLLSNSDVIGVDTTVAMQSIMRVGALNNSVRTPLVSAQVESTPSVTTTSTTTTTTAVGHETVKRITPMSSTTGTSGSNSGSHVVRIGAGTIVPGNRSRNGRSRIVSEKVN